MDPVIHKLGRVGRGSHSRAGGDSRLKSQVRDRAGMVSVDVEAEQIARKTRYCTVLGQGSDNE